MVGGGKSSAKDQRMARGRGVDGLTDTGNLLDDRVYEAQDLLRQLISRQVGKHRRQALMPCDQLLPVRAHALSTDSSRPTNTPFETPTNSIPDQFNPGQPPLSF